jgi:hypothetical protein
MNVVVKLQDGIPVSVGAAADTPAIILTASPLPRQTFEETPPRHATPRPGVHPRTYAAGTCPATASGIAQIITADAPLEQTVHRVAAGGPGLCGSR